MEVNELEKLLEVSKACDNQGRRIDVQTSYLNSSIYHYIDIGEIRTKRRLVSIDALKNIRAFVEEAYPGRNMTESEVKTLLSQYLDEAE